MTDNDRLAELEDVIKERDEKITNLEARLRLEEKRADDAEARNDFLITQLDELIRKAKS
jgi:hypothetical protein